MLETLQFILANPWNLFGTALLLYILTRWRPIRIEHCEEAD